ETAREAARVREKALGSGHVLLADTADTLGEVLWHLGDYDAAEAELARALRIRRTGFQGKHHGIGTSLLGLGMIAMLRARPAEALSFEENALRMFVETLDRAHPSVASAHEAIAEALCALRRPREAL